MRGIVQRNIDCSNKRQSWGKSGGRKCAPSPPGSRFERIFHLSRRRAARRARLGRQIGAGERRDHGVEHGLERLRLTQPFGITANLKIAEERDVVRMVFDVQLTQRERVGIIGERDERGIGRRRRGHSGLLNRGIVS